MLKSPLRCVVALSSLLTLSAADGDGVSGTPVAGAGEMVAPSDAGNAPTALEEEFKAALQRVRQHSPEPADSPALRSFILYDYLVAARLRRDLELKPGEDLDARIDEFLQTHGTEPVTRNLRSDWLTNLAARARWDWFLARSSDVTSPALICQRMNGKLASGQTQGLAAEALGRWSLAQKQPPECGAVFAWLRAQGLLTAARAESRARAALAADNAHLAREFMADVPAERAEPLLQWVRLLESPKAALEAIAASPPTNLEPAALLAGFEHLSRTDSSAALELLPRLLARPELTPAMGAKLQRAAALGAAYSRDPAALPAFDRLPDSAVDGDVREWRVRAALWAGDYDKALAWIADMPTSMASQPRWRYWRARAVAATAGADAATPFFADIAGLRDFYGYLAADRLHRGYALNARSSSDDKETQQTLAAQPGIARAHALFDCGLDDDASVEWAVALSSADNSLKLQAAHLAARWGWYSQSIMTLAQIGELDDVRLRYPRPYAEAIQQASKLTQLPPDWILAVMRQESLFREDAVSRAGARGLMQMMPPTATAVARRWHLPAPPRDGTFDANTDVQRGAAYLRELLDKYGELGLSLAAYNAGTLAVTRWLPTKSMDADIWIENIPYGETRNYVQRVMEHIVAFAWVRDAEPQRVSMLLAPIAPPTAFAARSEESPRH